MKILFFTSVAMAMALGVSITGVAEEPEARELGNVAWQRDFESAKKDSSNSGKPLLMFFQEVPG